MGLFGQLRRECCKGRRYLANPNSVLCPYYNDSSMFSFLKLVNFNLLKVNMTHFVRLISISKPLCLMSKTFFLGIMLLSMKMVSYLIVTKNNIGHLGKSYEVILKWKLCKVLKSCAGFLTLLCEATWLNKMKSYFVCQVSLAKYERTFLTKVWNHIARYGLLGLKWV